MTDLVAAASAALGVALSEPRALPGSDRSAVLRCESAAGGTVIVKSYPATEEGRAGFCAEAAGLEFITGSGVAPDLLATDPVHRVVVMRDLGAAPSLADVLLRPSREQPPARARQALLDWARACGELAAGTAGREQEFEVLLAAYQAATSSTAEAGPAEAGLTAAGPAGPPAHWLERRIWQVPGLLAGLSPELRVEPPAGLAGDLAAVTSLLTAQDYRVFSPGDQCPDNNLLTSGGVRFIDFESAEFHSVFLDAAYLRMPFSSCWCVFRLPADLAGAAQATYRELVARKYPDLAADEIWLPGVRRAGAAWTLHALTYLLRPSVLADGSLNPLATAAPTARQLLHYRWKWLAGELESAGELPALTALLRDLLTATQSWNPPPLPPYPAFP